MRRGERTERLEDGDLHDGRMVENDSDFVLMIRN